MPAKLFTLSYLLFTIHSGDTITMRLSSPVTAIRLTIARQRYYARAAAFAQRHAVSIYGSNPLDMRLYNATYEFALRQYLAMHPRKN